MKSEKSATQSLAQGYSFSLASWRKEIRNTRFNRDIKMKILLKLQSDNLITFPSAKKLLMDELTMEN